MQTFYDRGGVTLYHADCRDVLACLARESVDLILVDPTYGISYETNWRAKGDKLKRKLEGDDSLDVLAESWPLAMRCLRQDRHWYAFASPSRLVEAAAIFRRYKQVLVWDKGDRGSIGDLKGGYGECWEAVFYGMKGRRKLVGPRPRSVIRYDWQSHLDPVHPTVKPIALLQKLIAHSACESEVVLDFMAGSGTTLLAAKLAGCRAIGIETEREYCERAVDRLRQGVFAFA